MTKPEPGGAPSLDQSHTWSGVSQFTTRGRREERGEVRVLGRCSHARLPWWCHGSDAGVLFLMKSPTQSQLDGAVLSRLDSLVTPTPKLMLHHYQADQVRLQADLSGLVYVFLVVVIARLYLQINNWSSGNQPCHRFEWWPSLPYQSIPPTPPPPPPLAPVSH